MKTMNEAVTYLVRRMNPRDRAQIKALAKDRSPEDIAAGAHHGYGTSIRNDLNLWGPESADLREDIWNSLTTGRQEFHRDWWAKYSNRDHTGRNMHPDDASDTLLRAVIKRVLEIE